MGLHRFVGFDAKRFQRGKFHALLGVGVTIDNLDAYMQKYDEIIKGIFAKNGMERRRPLYKSFDLSKLFFTKGYDVPEQLFKELSGFVSFIDVYYSYFNRPIVAAPEEDEFINVYYAERSGLEKVAPIRFIDMIEHSYPAICAWRYCSKYRKFNPEIYTDHFMAHPSKIWDDLKSVQEYHIAYRGDQCNYLVNAADIFLSAIEKRIMDNDLRLNREIHKILMKEYNNKFETEFIGTAYLHALSPSHKHMVDVKGRIQHPVYFVFPEGKTEFQKMFPGQDETTFLENSIFLDAACLEATKNRGCVKMYDPAADNPLISSNDIFCYYGPKGKLKIEILSSLGYKNTIFSAKELANHT